jgi:hypothetical protein
MDVNTKYKSSVFTTLFSDKARLLELYNAIENTNYDPSTEIVINTLEDALYMDRINDISFTLGGKLVVLIEHQSTVNANMPLRFLLYIARIYEKIIDSKSIYRQGLVKIPQPEFIVLYNGVDPFPESQQYKLSEAFMELGNAKLPALELQVMVYNINKGHNQDMMQKSESFDGYVTFIDKIRENRKTMNMKMAVKDAIQYCIREHILSDFLQTHSSEVINMLFTEWNWDEAKAVWQEEAEARVRQQFAIKEYAYQQLLSAAGVPQDQIDSVMQVHG